MAAKLLAIYNISFNQTTTYGDDALAHRVNIGFYQAAIELTKNSSLYL
jgi:hypothetical protein